MTEDRRHYIRQEHMTCLTLYIIKMELTSPFLFHPTRYMVALSAPVMGAKLTGKDGFHVRINFHH